MDTITQDFANGTCINARKKSYNDALNRIFCDEERIENNKDYFLLKLIGIVATSEHKHIDEDLKSIFCDKIEDMFNELGESLRRDDKLICVVSLNKVYWEKDFSNLTIEEFEKYWNENYNGYEIVDENGETYTIKGLFNFINETLKK